MKTICKCCSKVLTDKNGIRRHNAIFDSSIPPYKKHTDNITYALCEKCYKKGLTRNQKSSIL